MDDYDCDEGDFLVDFDPFEHAADDYESQGDVKMSDEASATPKYPKDCDIDLRYSRENNLPRKVRPDDVKVKIIQLVKDYPCLYDRKCEFYNNPEFTDRAWNNVASRLGKSRHDCRNIFMNLFRDFATTYVILRDKDLVEKGYHRKKIFYYYDHMLYFRNQINIPIVRQTEVQNLVNEDRRGPGGRKRPAESGTTSSFDHNSALFEAEGEVRGNTNLKDVDLAYSEDNNLAEKVLPGDFNVKVINAVKAYPCLYDRMSENIKNSTVKDQAWTEVAQMINSEKGECKKAFSSLFREFSITYVILRDPQLVKMKLLPKVFIYYDHMLFYKKQINIPLVRRNEVQALLNIAEKTKKPRKSRRSNSDTEDFDCSEMPDLDDMDDEDEDLKAENATRDVSEIDLAYVRDFVKKQRINPHDKNIKLIEAVKKYRQLYDWKHPDYGKAIKCKPAWREVAEICKIQQSRSRFKSLFTRFSLTYVILRDPKLVKMGLPSLFIYYENMLFFRDYVKVHAVKKHHVSYIVKNFTNSKQYKRMKEENSPRSNQPSQGRNNMPRQQPGPPANSRFTGFPIDKRLAENQIRTLQTSDVAFETKLIRLVKEFPCMYNTYSEDYHNVRLKEEIWAEISRKCARNSAECRDAFNYLLKKFGEVYVGKMISRLGLPDKKRKPFRHYRTLRFLKLYIPLQQVKETLLQDPRYTPVQKRMIMEFQPSPDSSPDIDQLRVPRVWEEDRNAEDARGPPQPWQDGPVRRSPPPWENARDAVRTPPPPIWNSEPPSMNLSRSFDCEPEARGSDPWNSGPDGRSSGPWNSDSRDLRGGSQPWENESRPMPPRPTDREPNPWENESNNREARGPQPWERDLHPLPARPVDNGRDIRDLRGSQLWENDSHPMAPRSVNRDPNPWENESNNRGDAGGPQLWERDLHSLPPRPVDNEPDIRDLRDSQLWANESHPMAPRPTNSWDNGPNDRDVSGQKSWENELRSMVSRPIDSGSDARDFRGSQSWENDRFIPRNQPPWEDKPQSRGPSQLWDNEQISRDARDSSRSWMDEFDSRGNFSQLANNPTNPVPPPESHFSPFSGGVSSEFNQNGMNRSFDRGSDRGGFGGAPPPPPIVDDQEVDSFFYEISQKIKRTNIGSHTFIQLQAAVADVLAHKLPKY